MNNIIEWKGLSIDTTNLSYIVFVDIYDKLVILNKTNISAGIKVKKTKYDYIIYNLSGKKLSRGYDIIKVLDQIWR